jgi:2-polyprenyl-3-methyl-5-hydroxy-6-metoxy-1,4-benzoquinol methylase
LTSFEKEYFEGTSTYGKAGGYAAQSGMVLEFYHEYVRLALEAVPTLANGAGKSMLEVGCALGFGIAVFKDFGYEIYGTDISHYAVERVSTATGMPDHFAVADAQMPNPFGRKFDLVVSLHVVEHLPDERAGVRCLADAVAPGGHLVLATPNPVSVSYYREYQNDPTHVNEHPPEHWQALITQSGLTIVRSGTYHMLPVIHKLLGRRYYAVPRWLGYDTVMVAARPPAQPEPLGG